MKELIDIIGTVVLGCLLFQMIAGEEDSLKSSGARWMERNIEMYQEQ